LEYVVAVVVGMAIVWVWPRLRDGLRRALNGGGAAKSESGKEAPAPTEAALPANTEVAAPTPAEPQNPSTRLRELFTSIDAAINPSVPAREIEADPRFLEARRLLADTTVPVAVVGDYAIGSNWFLSCTALAALCDREDRDEVLYTVLAFFDTLSPWGMFFALKLLLAGDPRPPMGAPLAFAREWWRDNAFVIAAFREHLDDRSRLGDAPDIGSALDGKPQETHDLIRSFLARLNHPLATDLIESLEAARMRNVDRAFLTSFGSFWKSGAADLLVEPEIWTEALQQACSDGASSARAGPCSRPAAPSSWQASNGSASSRAASSAPSRSSRPQKSSSGTSPTFCRSR
jgi:hypothetical protein